MLDMKAFPNTIGERHPINFELMEKWYSDDAFCTGIVDKYVDFTLAGGFYIKTEEKNEKKIIVDWMRRNKFDNNLRDWLRKYFITGNGYLEMSGPKNKPPTSIKILDSRYMYVRRDNTGNILGYTQYMGGFNAPIFFDPHEIAHMKYKTIKDYAYGIGVIFPLTYTLIKKSEMIKDVCVIIKRKANSPIVGTVGTPESPASDEAVAQVAKNMEVLHSKTEISVSHLIKFGLNEKEKNQFKEYWLERLPKTNYYEVKILEEDFLKQNMELLISPEPDTLIRLNFYFKPLEQKINIQEPIINTPQRIGFTVVEWGGMVDN